MADTDPKNQDPSNPAGEGGANGTPDLKQQIERQKAEIADWKAKCEAAEQKYASEKAAREELDKQLKEALTEEDVNAAVEKALEKAEQEAERAEQGWKEREKRLTIENKLIEAGCIDAQAAMAHIDMDKVQIAPDGHISGLDVKELSESRKYLFDANGAGVSSAAEPGGGAKSIKTRKEIADIEDPDERMRLIEENLEASKS